MGFPPPPPRHTAAERTANTCSFNTICMGLKLPQDSNRLFQWLSTVDASGTAQPVEWPGYTAQTIWNTNFFPCPSRPRRLWDPPSLVFNEYGDSFPEVKRPGRESDHSPTFGPRLRIWMYISTPSIRPHSVKTDFTLQYGWNLTNACSTVYYFTRFSAR